MKRRAHTCLVEQQGWDVRDVRRRQGLVIVIVTFNSASHIARALQPLADHHIVVVDNNSTDGTRDLVAAEFPRTRLIRMSRNVGLSTGFNVGWNQVPGCDILFLNPDVIVEPGGVDKLHAAMKDLPQAAVVAPRLLNPDGSVQHTARTFPTLTSIVARRTPLGRTSWGKQVLRSHLDPAGEARDPVAVDWVLGAAMLVPAHALQCLGGFDERYFLYCEDVDFCARAWQRSRETVYFPGVTFVHEYQRQSRRSWDFSSRATRAHWRSLLRLFCSYPSHAVHRPLRPIGSSARCR